MQCKSWAQMQVTEKSPKTQYIRFNIFKSTCIFKILKFPNNVVRRVYRRRTERALGAHCFREFGDLRIKNTKCAHVLSKLHTLRDRQKQRGRGRGAAVKKVRLETVVNFVSVVYVLSTPWRHGTAV